MLRIHPDERITAEQALDHPYFKLTPEELESSKKIQLLKPSDINTNY